MKKRQDTTTGNVNIKRMLVVGLFALIAMSMRAQMVVVGTEATSDLMLAPNVGLEIVTGNHSSMGLSLLHSPKLLGFGLKMTAIQPEYRYWFSYRPVNKWFVGFGGIGALFEGTIKEKHYDGYGIGLGITYGYVWNITDRLNIEVHSGFGAFYYNRKEFFEGDNYDVDYTEDGAQRANAKGYYLLPTRIGVSVSYILK
jgi:hypothetical protein